MISRRELFKIGGMALLLPSIGKIQETISAPAITSLGKELTSPRTLMTPGFYNATIENIWVKPSIRDGSNNFFVSLLLENKERLNYVFNEMHPYPMLELLRKCSIDGPYDVVDADVLIGKEIKVKVDEIEFKGKKYNEVRKVV